MEKSTESTYSPRFGIVVAFAAALVGLNYGFDSGSIGGALIFLREDFQMSTLTVALVTTIVVIGSLAGAMIGPMLTNGLGRKKVMIIVGIGFTIFSALSAIEVNPAYLITVRFFLGMTIGLSTIAAPVFISEFAPVKIRGALGMSYQLATSIGVILSLIVGYLFASIGGWQWILGISAIPSAIIVVVLWNFPDTPRWYMMKGRKEEALAALKKIEHPDNVEEEFKKIEADMAGNEKGYFREAFQRKYARPTLFVIVFGFIVQITGINTILYYSPIIFQSVGIESDGTSILLSALVNVFSVIGIILSILTVDRWGRRPILLLGTGGMILGNLSMIAVSMQNTLTPLLGYLAIAGIALFNMSFFFGIGSLIWVYLGEMFPARLRSVGAALLLMSDFIANIIATFAFPFVLDIWGGAIAFGIFLLLAIASWIFLYFMAPETKGRSLEDIRTYWANGGKWPSGSSDIVKKYKETGV